MSVQRIRWRNRAGQALVEFVLIAPILLLLLFGIIEFARGWNIRHVVTDAARESARHLVIHHDVSAATVVVNQALTSAGLNPANATVNITGNAGTQGQPATVSIRYPYQLGPTRLLLGWAVQDGTINIGTTFVMRNE